MKRPNLIPITLLVVALLLGACYPPDLSMPPAPAASPAAGMANPASENCIQQGGLLEIRDEASGQVGYCKFADGSECEEWALMHGECQPGQPASVTQPTVGFDPSAVAPGTLDRAAMLAPRDMSGSPLLDGLADWEQAVLDKLIQAARYMDAAFWQQVDPEGEVIFKGLTGATTDLEKATRLMLDANYGRWDRFQDFAPFLGSTPWPAGSYVYPPDLTKVELDAYLASHPDEKEDLLDPYTVVRRQGDRLVAVPYHEVYAAYVQPAAALLDEAAGLSSNASLANYLRLEAEALRTDDYFAANMAWLDLDANLDVSIGPHEVYDDQLTGQKAFYKANVLLVDRPAGNQLARLMDTVPELQANLPVPEEFRPSQAGTMTPLELADDIYRSGQVRAVMEGVAFSLPNDPKVWEAKGAKKVMMRNYLEARRTLVLTPLLNEIADEELAQQLDPGTYFNWVLLHEVAHTLGPRTVNNAGKEVTVGQALDQYYSPIEEAKADIAGLYSVPYLSEQGIITGTLASHYAGYLAESLRSIRFGFGSSYGMARSAAWNYFVEREALLYDAAKSRFTLDETRMTEAVKELTTTLMTIEGNGDIAAAAAFFDKYMPVKPELQKLLDQAGETVPIEFVPTYPER